MRNHRLTSGVGAVGLAAALGVVVGLQVMSALMPGAATAFPAVAQEHGVEGRIVFAKEVEGNWDIYVVNADGTGEEQLTTDAARDTNPQWSLDGSEIAFESDRGDVHASYVMAADGTVQRPAFGGGIPGASEVAWAPDWSRVAFVHADAGGNAQILVANADGSGATQVTTQPFNHHSPAWSPEGGRIAYASDRSSGDSGVGTSAIYVAGSDGSNEARVTDGESGPDASPEWSPDGSALAFSRRDGPGSHVYTITPGGEDDRRITSGETIDKDPAWSPDSEYVVYASDGGDGADLWITSSDGNDTMQVTAYPPEIDVAQPDWAAAPGSPKDSESDGGSDLWLYVGAGVAVVVVLLTVGLWVQRRSQRSD